jgi:aconitate hydratase 2/2-methylisocitrate dehydratase
MVELVTVCAILGEVPTVEKYMAIVAQKVYWFKGDLYRYLNFDEIAGFEDFGRVIPVDKIRCLS